MKGKILKTIRSRFKECRFSVYSLAEDLNISGSYLRELSNKYFGMPPCRLIETIRLEEVLRMLKEGKSVHWTRSGAGYKNERTFRYAFKKRFGVCCMKFKEKIDEEGLKEDDMIRYRILLWNEKK